MLWRKDITYSYLVVLKSMNCSSFRLLLSFSIPIQYFKNKCFGKYSLIKHSDNGKIIKHWYRKIGSKLAWKSIPIKIIYWYIIHYFSINNRKEWVSIELDWANVKMLRISKLCKLSFFLISRIHNSGNVVVVILPAVSRRIKFEDIRRSFRLTGSSKLKTQLTSSHLRARLCGKTPRCRYFNYCLSKLCELNSDDVYSIGQNQFLLQGDPKCVYNGMIKDSTPECLERGAPKDIQDDGDPGYCAINEKRVDQIWGPWKKETTVDTQDEYKEVLKKKMQMVPAHGGKNDGISGLQCSLR